MPDPVATRNYVDDMAARIGAAVPGKPIELLRQYALVAIVKGTSVTIEDVHSAWATWCAATRPDHPNLIPFGQLTLAAQERDVKYRDAIRAAAASLALEAISRPQPGDGMAAAGVRHDFTNRVSGRVSDQTFTLVIPNGGRLLPRDGEPKIGVAHDGCLELADLSLDLDAFYCVACGLNGRISGAWACGCIEEAKATHDKHAAGLAVTADA